MSLKPSLSGALPPDGIVGLMRILETRRITGVLRFSSESSEGEVAVVRGQISADQEHMRDGRDPVDVLLGLREGTFELVQRLPQLPVSQGDDAWRRGSLSVHTPSDLMNYCEAAGLTGMLTLEYDGRRAELGYDRGDLILIRVDGTEDAHLNEVFDWDQGTFLVEATHEAPVFSKTLQAIDSPEPVPLPPAVATSQRRDETGQHLLRVVEVSLSTILKERDSRKPSSNKAETVSGGPTKQHSSLPPVSPVEEPPHDPTVRVIYVNRESPPHMHQQYKSATGYELPLKESSARMVLKTASWILLLVVVGLATIWMLSRLPSVE